MKMMIMMMEMIHIYLLVKKLFTQQSKSLTPSLIRYRFRRAGCTRRGNYHITEEALERQRALNKCKRDEMDEALQSLPHPFQGMVLNPDGKKNCQEESSGSRSPIPDSHQGPDSSNLLSSWGMWAAG
ncbi:unnamed protein product [Brassica rapa]|uniref:Uncharacterized protein n=2 Tax=Brassica TaxID=3705 RepID=A0A8D9GXY1_BRACM|nr:unnamed protein product [Brassica napus]CAG7888980.1 unnamed protein product [Brassica rapa]